MPDRDYKRSQSGRGSVWQQAAQEATLAREQDNRAADGSERRTLKEEEATKPTITLQDGSVVEANRAVNKWYLLENFPQEETAAFRTLLTLAQGRSPVDADARHFEALMSRNFVNEDHTIDPVTRAVLLNSFTTVDCKPMIGALRLKSTADKAVLEEARAQLHQSLSEGYARAVSPGGWFDQLMKKMERERGKGKSGRE
jgi:hypothetical protein